MNIEETAKQIVKDGQASCVIIKKDKIIRKVDGRGVTPLISIYENEPDLLRDAFVIDKVIGKAAAVIIVLGGAKKVYGEVMSTAAFDYLYNRNYEVNYGKKIDIVANRSGDGICPLEKSVLDTEDPEKGYYLLKETINRLKTAD